MVLLGSGMYAYGEIKGKEFKYAMGVPIGILGCVVMHSFIPLFCILSYYIGANFGYGDNNPLTKWLGKRGAITFCGAMVGLASMPILGFFAILQALFSAMAWYLLSIADDAGKIKEPYVGIIRGLTATIFLLGA